MSRTDAETEILAPMQALFLPPRNMDDVAQKAGLTAYLDTLQDFGRDDLRTAWREVVAAHTTRAWPVPGVIVLAARKARKDRAPTATEARRKDATYMEKRLLWDRVRASGLAQRAARENVAWSFKCAVLYDGKPPETISLHDLKRAKQSAEDTASQISTGQELFRADKTTGELYPIGIMDGANRQRALTMWSVIEGQERETQDEIRRASRGGVPPASTSPPPEQFA